MVLPEALLGENVIANTGASIDRERVLEAFVHIGPTVPLADAVVLREGVLLGSRACRVQETEAEA